MIEEKAFALVEQRTEAAASAIADLVRESICELVDGDIADKEGVMYASAARPRDKEPSGCIAVTVHNDDYLREGPAGRWGPPTLFIDPVILANDLLECIEGERDRLYFADRERYAALAARMREAAATIEGVVERYADRIVSDEA